MQKDIATYTDIVRDKILKTPAKDHRFQVIGLDLSLRSGFLSKCKLNNKSGSTVIKELMQGYIDAK